MRGASAAAQHCRKPRMKRVINLLWANEMNMAVKTTSGKNMALGGNRLGSRANNDINAGLGVGITGFANGANLAVFQTDIRFINTRNVDDQSVGDNRINGAIGACYLRLAHAITNDLAAAKLDLFAIAGEIMLDLDNQISIGQTHTVAGCWSIHISIDASGYFGSHL